MSESWNVFESRNVVVPRAGGGFCRRMGLGIALAALGVGLASVALAAGAAIEIVYSFAGGEDGKFPEEALIEHEGVLYGTTANDITVGECGTVFGLTLEGEKTFTYAQTQADGCQAKRLAVGTDGNLYGVTALFGGSGSLGTIFRITTEGVFTRLHGFSATGQTNVKDGLISASDGSLYGTTSSGPMTFPIGGGSVFRLTLLGGDSVEVTHIHTFSLGELGLFGPTTALIEDGETNGLFYGTTPGAIFSITSDGAPDFLHIFDGAGPTGPLVLAPDGLLYGLIGLGGGDFGSGAVFRIATDGSGYEILASFSSGSNGLGLPSGGLTVGADGSLYGVAGGIFRLTTAGELTTLISIGELLEAFDAGTTGGAAVGSLAGSLIWGSDGHLYGTSRAAGTGACTGAIGDTVIGCGTVFRVVLGGDGDDDGDGDGDGDGNGNGDGDGNGNGNGNGSTSGGGGGGALNTALLMLLAAAALRRRHPR